MLRRALVSTREILSDPRPLIPISLVFALANFLSWWASGYLKQNALAAVFVLTFSAVRAWAALGVQNVALGLARGEPAADAGFRAWVSPGVLLQFTLIGLVLGVGLFLAGLLAASVLKLGAIGAPLAVLLAGAVVYATVAVSQYPLLLLDERADMTDSVMLSADLTKGHRGVLLVAFLLPLLVIAVATSGVFQLAGIQAPGDAPLAFAALVPVGTAVYACWACLNAAMFLELLADHDRRLAEEAAPA